MAIEVIERTESGTIGVSEATSRWWIRGAFDAVEARTALQNVAPGFIDPFGTGITFWPRVDVIVETTAQGLHDGTVVYGPGGGTPGPAGSFTFETGGGTQHITQSLQTLQAVERGGTFDPPFDKAIGVAWDGTVAGADIILPLFEFSETHTKDTSIFTRAYIMNLFHLTSRINNRPFRGFAPGEVLFLGASGSQTAPGSWEITYKFAASPNVGQEEIGEFAPRIVIAPRRGWDYRWVRYREFNDGPQRMVRTRAVEAFVEKVYLDGDYRVLQIGE